MGTSPSRPVFSCRIYGMSTDEEEMSLDCIVHGRKAWDGQVMCIVCGRTYRLGRVVEVAPPNYPFCECGVRLSPDQDEEGVTDDSQWSAVPICADCYAEHHPRVPDDVRRRKIN
jgi:hypothetical protein